MEYIGFSGLNTRQKRGAKWKKPEQKTTYCMIPLT